MFSSARRPGVGWLGGRLSGCLEGLDHSNSEPCVAWLVFFSSLFRLAWYIGGRLPLGFPCSPQARGLSGHYAPTAVANVERRYQ